MKLRLLKSTTLPATTLLILTSFLCLPISGIRSTFTQDEARQIERLHRVLGIGSDEEKRRAIGQLSKITTEKANELLLETLKNNLAYKRGNDVRYGSVTNEDGIQLTGSPSQNELLVKALGNRRYKKALPTLRKMLKMNEQWLGFSKEAVAANIYLISHQPVKYTVDGEVKIYPEPKLETDADSFTNSLSMPSSGEAAWEDNSLNKRIRELVRVLGNAGGPAGVRDPFYRTLKEEIGRATLVSLVKSDDPLIRPYAAEALGILGENANEIIPVLTDTARDKDPRVRFRSVRALGHLLISNIKPEEATIIIAALKNALSDAEAEVRLASIQWLGTYAIGRDGSMRARMKEVVPLLVSALEDRAGYVRNGAAFALGWIGPLTSEVVPSLMRLLNSPQPSDREGWRKLWSRSPPTTIVLDRAENASGWEKRSGGRCSQQ